MIRFSITSVIISMLTFLNITHAATIHGVVVNERCIPVPYLQVIVEQTPFGDVTDDNGRFNIENIPAGTYNIRLDHVGYHSEYIAELRIGASQITDIGRIVVTQKVIGLDGVAITATRSDRRIMEISQPLNIVSGIRIQRRQAKTSAEALREETGIFIQKTNHGGGSAIIRGLSSNQILLLVDGIRLNNSTYRLGNHQYLTTVDQNMLRQIEVVRGPTSVLYGSDALGGTINLVTTKPALPESGLSLHYRLLGRYASADNERMTHSAFSLHHDKFSILAGFGSKKFDDLKRGGNSNHPQLENATNGLKQSPSGYDSYDFNSKLIYRPSDRQLLIFAWQLTRQNNVPRYDKYENANYHRWMYQPQQRELVYAIYEHRLNSYYLSSWRTTISLHRQQEGREIQKTVSDRLTLDLDDVQTIGITLQGHSIQGSHFLTFGAEIYLDDVSSERKFTNVVNEETEQDVRGRYPDGATYNSFGLFLQDEFRLNSHLSVIAGLRASWFATGFDAAKDSHSALQLGTVNQNFRALTGSMGVLFRLNKNLVLNGNLGQAFRAPNLSDLTKLGESKGNVFEVPNTSLKPEKMISGDVGFKYQTARMMADASVYYAAINDLIASANALYNGATFIEREGVVYKIKSKANLGTGFIHGSELTIRTQIRRNLFARAMVTATYGQNTTADEPIGGIPPLFGLIGIQWQTTHYDIELYSRFAQRQDRLSADDLDDPRIPDGGTPGWWIVNIRSRVRVTDGVLLHLMLENIFDYNYREHGSGINGPGRNFIISLELTN